MAGRIALVLGLLLVWLIALMPLKAVALAAGGSQALGYRDVFGTIWQGRVYGLEVNGVPVREVAVSLDPLALLTGQLGGAWQIADTRLRGTGHVRLGRERMVFEQTDLTVTLDRLGLDRLPGLTRDAPIFARIDRIELRDGACLDASGIAQSRALVSLASLSDRTGPALSGTFSCDGDQLVLDWGGAVEGLGIAGRVVFGDAAYDWTATVETDWPDLADALALSGMTRDRGVWRASGRENYAAGVDG